MGSARLAAVAVALALAVALSLAARLPDGTSLGLMLTLNGPRTLLGAAVGLAFAASAVVERRQDRNPLREVYVFGFSLGAASGGAYGLAAGWVGALAAGLAGALLYVAVLRLAQRPRRVANLALAGVLVSMLVIAVPASVAARSDFSGLRPVLIWLMGDLSEARFAGAAIVFVASAVGAVIVGRRLERGDPPASLAAAASMLSGLAIGAGGVIAFAGWLAATLGARLFRKSESLVWIGTVLLGAVVVIAADAVPRALYGGYAMPINLALGAVAVPAFLWWNRRRLRRFAPVAGSAFEWAELGVIATVAIVFALFLALLSYVVGLLT